MRKLALLAAVPFFLAGAALAQPAPQPAAQTNAAPTSTAPIASRMTWCGSYVDEVVSQAPSQGALPSDVRPTHRVEVELNSCTLDPQTYEQQTAAERPAPQPAQPRPNQ